MIDGQRLIAVITGVEVSQVGTQRPVPEIESLDQVYQVLLINVIQFAAPQTQCGVGLRELVSTAQIIELVRRTADRRPDILTIGAGAVVHFTQLAGLNIQVLDFAHAQSAAGVGLRQQTKVTGLGDRDGREQVADLEDSVRHLGLGRTGYVTVAIRAFIAKGAGQQASACGRVFGVQLQARSGIHVKAKADDALRVARLGSQNKALSPFFCL